MIKFNLGNILNLGLPLNSYSQVCRRGDSKRILLELDKKYKHSINPSIACMRSKTPTGKIDWHFYENTAFHYVDYLDKKRWIENYQIFIKSSLKYKFWIFFYKNIKPFLVN